MATLIRKLMLIPGLLALYDVEDRAARGPWCSVQTLWRYIGAPGKAYGEFVNRWGVGDPSSLFAKRAFIDGATVDLIAPCAVLDMLAQAPLYIDPETRRMLKVAFTVTPAAMAATEETPAAA